MLTKAQFRKVAALGGSVTHEQSPAKAAAHAAMIATHKRGIPVNPCPAPLRALLSQTRATLDAHTPGELRQAGATSARSWEIDQGAPSRSIARWTNARYSPPPKYHAALATWCHATIAAGIKLDHARDQLTNPHNPRKNPHHLSEDHPKTS